MRALLYWSWYVSFGAGRFSAVASVDFSARIAQSTQRAGEWRTELSEGSGLEVGPPRRRLALVWHAMVSYASSDCFTRPYPTIGYCSVHAPLLSQLHDRLTEYEDAVAHVYSIHEKYGDPRGPVEPPSNEMISRLKRTSQAFDAVLQHVDAVDEHMDKDYVLLHRDACGPTNSLYKAAPSVEEDEDKQRTFRTRSPILCNAHELNVSFRPYPSAEVLLQSSILAHSRELRMLASPPSFMYS